MGTNTSSLVTGGGDHRGAWAARSSNSSYRIGMSTTTDHLSALAKDKKRKVTSFATLRKKFAMRRRRSSKSFDHAKAIRDFVSDWTPRELHALVQDYEASAAFKEVFLAAEASRPTVPSLQRDLSDLYDLKHCADVELVFGGVCFPAHRPLLSVRCPYFRELLTRHPGHCARVPVDIRAPGMDAITFSALLRFLYTGQIAPNASRLEVLMLLGHEFGIPNPLEDDLRHLLDTGEYADAVLVFTSEPSLQSTATVTSTQGSHDSASTAACQGEYGFSTAARLELPCHKAILSARSPFFRNLLQRRARSGEETTERALRTPTRIVLDESVISKRYARVLLQAIYLDTVELTGILRGSPSNSSLSEVQAMVSGRSHHPSITDEAMEIYQIGRFLELDILAQGCEDIITESLMVENLVSVLRWSEQPHGSAWVHRQAMHFLREEFQVVAASSVLLDLDRSHLVSALQSDFLQTSELEVLQAVLRWGEQQLVRRMEEREPNLLSHTAHSVTKKGVKKRDLNDNELRYVLAELLPLVRIPHVLPANHELLVQAARRHLLSTPPSDMLSDDVDAGVATLERRVSAWLRGTNNGLFVKPRLFTPYVEEVKAILDEHTVQECELVRLRLVRMSHIPDTLYMVEEKPAATYSTASVDVVAGAIPVPDSETIQAMLKREAELRQSMSVQRTFALPLTNRADINRQLQLRVVREFNLPDSVADVVQSAAYYYLDSEDEAPVVGGRHCRGSSGCLCPTRASYPCLDSFTSPYSHYMTIETEAGSCSDGHLSDIMPDIAMATASLTQLGFQDGEMELDLGDRNSRSGSMFL